MDQHPTTEEPTNEAQSAEPSEPILEGWAEKRGVKLPEKVAELRRKLYLKAK